ncbi:MAG: arsenate reductase (glutaredoxin) [Calditrichaeota bacterium]|nr:MAG: arsenate reductase (glutaredoxin) [Calditrichota bacterium]
MSEIKIYHNNRCSKSRNTLAILEEKNANFEIVNYLETPPSETELDSILQKLGKEPQEIVRKGEQIYKDLNLKNVSLSRKEWIKTLVENPKLIERPIVVTGEKAVLGRPPENVLELI